MLKAASIMGSACSKSYPDNHFASVIVHEVLVIAVIVGPFDIVRSCVLDHPAAVPSIQQVKGFSKGLLG